MKFSYAIGNPPYQEITAQKETTTDMLARKNVFQNFQKEVETVANNTCLIYPAKRWINRDGKGMQIFGKEQINDTHLKALMVFEDATIPFPGIGIGDGISIVLKDMEREREQFDYTYIKSIDDKQTVQVCHPGDNMFSIDPSYNSIIIKIKKFVKDNNLAWLKNSIQTQKLFAVESNFVEENPDKVRLYYEGDILADDEIKLLTNDSSGSKGKPHWYITKKSYITKGQEFFDKYIVILPSVNLARLHQLDYVKPNEIFGRAKVGIKAFDNLDETKAFMKYMQSIFIQYTIILSGGSLTNAGTITPDIIDYKHSDLIDLSKNIDEQFKYLLNITDDEWNKINALVNEKVKRARIEEA